MTKLKAICAASFFVTISMSFFINGNGELLYLDETQSTVVMVALLAVAVPSAILLAYKAKGLWRALALVVLLGYFLLFVVPTSGWL